jgi:hypothetical protein
MLSPGRSASLPLLLLLLLLVLTAPSVVSARGGKPNPPTVPNHCDSLPAHP